MPTAKPGSSQTSDDQYAGMAERYDLFFAEPFGEYGEERAAFFRRLFQESGTRSVLDCACGTGRDLPLFHALGLEVVGSDISEAMLEQSRANLVKLGTDLPLHRADYRELPEHFRRRFDAVVCLSSSILHMPDEAEALRAFRSMRAVLTEGGVLVLTQGTSDRQWREKPRFLLARDRPEFTRLFVIDYAGEGARYSVLDIWHDGGGRLEAWNTDYPHVLLRDDQERLLHQAGFDTIEFYGGFDFAPYDRDTSNRLITVARRTRR